MALSANKFRPRKGHVEYQQYGVVGYTNYQGGNTEHTIYKGSIVKMDVSDVDGYAQKKLSSVASASGDVFLGVAEEKVVVSSSETSDGAKKIKVATSGLFGFAVGSLTVTDIGAPAYASDDDTITTTSTDALWVGTIRNVDDDFVWVDIGHATGRTNTAT